MTRFGFRFLSVAAVLALGLAISPAAWAGCGSCAADHSSKATKGHSHHMDIVDTAIHAGSFSTLVAAVQAADLAATLKGKGPFTVFAPTDDAFAKLPEGTVASLLLPENKAKLQSILTYHVIPGKVMSGEVVGLSSAKTVQGKALTIAVKDGTVRIDGARIVKADIGTSNGVIHVIDSVVLPN